jgi:ATP-dependent protease Clp ATPase subunit
MALRFCSHCGASEYTVKHLVKHAHVYTCGECIDVLGELLSAARRHGADGAPLHTPHAIPHADESRHSDGMNREADHGR